MQDRREFSKDQKRNVTGSRGNRWNTITFRLALAIYVRSPSAYRALKGFKILNLPSKTTLQKFTRSKLDGPGEADRYLAAEMKKYDQFKENLKNEQKPVPDGYGILIFDEVKVISNTLFNSKNNAMIGYAMTAEEMWRLHDIYLTLDKKQQKTNYIMQFLWRDLCSQFDVLGPYYTSVNSLEHKFVLACIFDAMVKLHQYSFKTKVIMCDGASSNLTALKMLMGHRGTFGHSVKEDGIVSHVVIPKFYNPYTLEDIYLMICPTHQLKNLVSQLYASREKGTKNFQNNGIFFGWKAIYAVYQRQIKNAKDGNALRVPGLKLSYVVRDSWTRLNVKPAKIMQQPPMLAELRLMRDDTVDQPSKDSINMTIEYLEALNKLFEQGFLSNYRVSCEDKRCLDSILNGNKFFESWLTNLLGMPGSYKATDSRQKLFIAWQTWDLQRVLVYGFKELCTDFFQKYENNFFLAPKRLNGSAIETLFSQFKDIAGSKLSATNYATARASYLMKVAIHGRRHAEEDYRNVPLYIRQLDLTQ